MANSINTNAGALIALQNLNATNRDLNVTQNRVNTGLKVSTAKDNGAIFAIATSQRAEMGALDSVKQSIQRGQSIVDVALAAGEIVTKALEEQKGLAVAIASSTGDAQTAYLADFNALGNEITKALGGASFDGVNLFKANAAAVDVRTGTGAGDTFTVKAIAGGGDRGHRNDRCGRGRHHGLHRRVGRPGHQVQVDGSPADLRQQDAGLA